jgi:D-glycero-alpha-D-manno-heptose-7-phosphate kinase
VPLSDQTCRTLERRCLLAYTGESRISGTTITAVLDAYKERVPRVVDALDRMAQLGRLMHAALALGDVDELATLVDEHWQHQRALHPGITTARIDALENAARSAGATGLKALGASGGGLRDRLCRRR